MKDLMIDVETLGTRPGSVVLSIGAVMFGPEGLGNEFYVELRYDDLLAHGFKQDADTLKWWFNQPNKPPINGEMRVCEGLLRFSEFCKAQKFERVWAKSPQFDVVMLEEMYRTLYLGVDVPWTYKQPRDVRTALDMLRPIGKQTLDELWKGKIEHNALDDAKLQAQHLIVARLFDNLQ